MALEGIDSVLTGEILGLLDRLGHSDSVVIADAHFPAHRLGTVVVEVPGLSAPRVTQAVRSVISLDGDDSTQLMAAADGKLSEVQAEMVSAARIADPSVVQMVERFAFYKEAESACFILRTGEARPYGNLILRKGTFPLVPGEGLL